MKWFSMFIGFVCATAMAGTVAWADPPRQTYTDAMGWYLKAAKAGEPRAQFLLAMQYELGVRGKPDVGKALHWYKKAAKGGYAQAQYKLGLMMSKDGAATDLKQAASWFHEAAKNGISDAAFNYALMCEQGIGVDQNLEQAAEWYETAAVKGQAKSAMSLAVLFSRGLNGKPDRVKALGWLRVAEAMGETIPDPIATLFRLKLPDEDVTKAKAFADEWLSKR